MSPKKRAAKARQRHRRRQRNLIHGVILAAFAVSVVLRLEHVDFVALALGIVTEIWP